MPSKKPPPLIAGTERAREVARKGGQSRSVKKISAAIQNISKSPTWMKKHKLTKEQTHFMALMSNNQFVTAIKDMLIMIASKAKEAEDYHKLLNQLMKIPFLQQAMEDLKKERQKDIIPIVVEVLRKNGREDIIKELFTELENNGWGAANDEKLV